MGKNLPYPVASVVEMAGRKYLIDEVDIQFDIEGEDTPEVLSHVEYSVIGTKRLGSEGYGSAWHSHDDLTLIEMPTKESWEDLIKVGGRLSGNHRLDAEDR